MRLTLALLSITAFGGSAGWAQQVVSAHSGVVHYSEGRVFVGDRPVERKFGVFPDLHEGEELRTEAGRAEVLLTPGAFLRVSENSSVRMISRQLSDTRVEILSGSVMVECDELLKGTALNLVANGATIQIEKHGLYRLDTDPPRFRVYDGMAEVQTGSTPLKLTRGREAGLNGALTAQKFNRKEGDPFYNWNGLRSGFIASANVSAAQSLVSNGTRWSSSGWLWDPWYGSFTFVPRGGVFFNPFGWGFWSPGLVEYAPPPIYGYAPQNAGRVPGRTSAGNGNSAGSGVARTPPPSTGIGPGGFGGVPNGGAPQGGGMRGGGIPSGGGISNGAPPGRSAPAGRSR